MYTLTDIEAEMMNSGNKAKRDILYQSLKYRFGCLIEETKYHTQYKPIYVYHPSGYLLDVFYQEIKND